MNVLETVRRIDKRLLLTVIGVLIGAGGLYAGLHEARPSISMTIVNEANVLDVHKPLEELSVSFKGEDIQEENLNLRIMTLRIENDGEVDILQTYFDRDSIWGMKVENGDIIEVRLVNTNSDYIEANLNLTLIEDINSIQFDKVIFERQNYFTVEILVLHERMVMPEIVPMGKIAGVEKVEVRRADVNSEESFTKETFSGNAWIQLVRVICYLPGGVIVIVIAVLIAFGISDVNSKRKEKSRRNRVKHFFAELTGTKATKSNIIDALEDVYASEGDKGLLAANAIMKEPNTYKQYMEEERRRARLFRRISGEERKQRVEAMELVRMETDREFITSKLVDKGIVRIDKNEKVAVERGFRKALDELLQHLNIQKEEQ